VGGANGDRSEQVGVGGDELGHELEGLVVGVVLGEPLRVHGGLADAVGDLGIDLGLDVLDVDLVRQLERLDGGADAVVDADVDQAGDAVLGPDVKVKRLTGIKGMEAWLSLAREGSIELLSVRARYLAQGLDALVVGHRRSLEAPHLRAGVRLLQAEGRCGERQESNGNRSDAHGGDVSLAGTSASNRTAGAIQKEAQRQDVQ